MPPTPPGSAGACCSTNRLAAVKRLALPPELHSARPERLRLVLLNGIGEVVRRARETILRLAGETRRRLADAARLALALLRPRSPPRPPAA